MPVRTPKDLTQSLKQGKIAPVYFLFGPEAFLRDEAARAIADEALRNTLLRAIPHSQVQGEKHTGRESPVGEKR